MDEKMNEIYLRDLAYAERKNLTDLKKALEFVRRDPILQSEEGLPQLAHGLEVCDLLIDLHLPLPSDEENALLAAAIIHIYPETTPVADLHRELTEHLGLPEAVFEIVERMLPGRNLTQEQQQSYYRRVQEHRLALLVELADRGNVVQKLYRYSTWNAHRYIEETKICYYPMCIYGKEHYHDLLAPISVLLEKMRSLVEVGEILLRRYEVREAELIRDIMAVREENATLKGIIAKFKGEQ